MTGFRQIILPYCLKRMEDSTYIILNRRYKPIGFDTTEFLRYEDYPICHRIKEINQNTAASFSWYGDDNTDINTDIIHLYHDDSISTSSPENMRSYLD